MSAGIRSASSGTEPEAKPGSLERVSGGSPSRARLRPLAAVGALGSCCILSGTFLPGSPFVVHSAGSWVVVPASSPSNGNEGTAQFIGIALVYLGILLLIGAWLETLRATRADPRLGIREMVPLLLSWTAPIVLAPPLFSRDVYSYAAQGQMVSKGLNPYLHGPAVLHSGSFLGLVDPLWRHATAPYGPAWERLSGWLVQLSGHRVVASVVGFRLVALVGIALLAWGVPALATSVGRSASVAFVLGVLNPLVLLVLLGGAHNDTLLVGLLVVSCALAPRGRVLAAVVVCALAAEVKAPALIAAAFIGWVWWKQEGTTRRRAGWAVAASLVTVAVMVVVGAVADLGWRWVANLLAAGTVVSWLDPSTAAGLAVGHVTRALGYHGSLMPFVDSARVIALVTALGIAVRLLVRSQPDSVVDALGWSLLALVLLGPVVWPWYEAWGFVLLAVVAEGWTLRLVVALSAIACFADVQSPHLLFTASPAIVVIGGWTLVTAAVVWYFTNRRPLALRVPSRTG